MSRDRWWVSLRLKRADGGGPSPAVYRRISAVSRRRGFGLASDSRLVRIRFRFRPSGQPEEENVRAWNLAANLRRSGAKLVELRIRWRGLCAPISRRRGSASDLI